MFTPFINIFLYVVIILVCIAIFAIILLASWFIIWLGVAICMIAFKDQDQIDEIIANKYRRIPEICAWGFVIILVCLLIFLAIGIFT